MSEAEPVSKPKYEKGNRVAFRSAGAVYAREPFAVATIKKVVEEERGFQCEIETDHKVAIKTSPFSGFSTHNISLHESRFTFYYDLPQIPTEK